MHPRSGKTTNSYTDGLDSMPEQSLFRLNDSQRYFFLSLNNVCPFTSHETPKANSATDSSISTGFIAAREVPRQKTLYRVMHTIARIITIPQER